MAVCACMRASFHTLGVGGSEGAGISGHKAGQKVTAESILSFHFYLGSKDHSQIDYQAYETSSLTHQDIYCATKLFLIYV